MNNTMQAIRALKVGQIIDLIDERYDFNEAISGIQDAMGVDTGDIAGLFFHFSGGEFGDIEETWPGLRFAAKLDIALRYVAFEWLHAEDDNRHPPSKLELKNGYTVYEDPEDYTLMVENKFGHKFQLDMASKEFFQSLTKEEVFQIDRLWRYDASPEGDNDDVKPFDVDGDASCSADNDKDLIAQSSAIAQSRANELDVIGICEKLADIKMEIEGWMGENGPTQRGMELLEEVTTSLDKAANLLDTFYVI